jgi:hypothetical protein
VATRITYGDGRVRWELTTEEYEYLRKRSEIVDTLIDLVAEKLIDIPKNEERIREVIEKLNKEELT